jgi:hypothetical protein
MATPFTDELDRLRTGTLRHYEQTCAHRDEALRNLPADTSLRTMDNLALIRRWAAFVDSIAADYRQLLAGHYEAVGA